MKNKNIVLLGVGITALSLTSCSRSVTYEEFKATVIKNSKKEMNAMKSGKIKLIVKDYKFESNDNSLESIFKATLTIAVTTAIKEAGFTIPKDYDVTKGFNDSRDLTSDELKALQLQRVTENTVDDIFKDDDYEYFLDGDKAEIKYQELESNMKVEQTVRADEFAILNESETCFAGDLKDGDTWAKLSLFIGTYSTYSF